jgi:solute carrier family 39 (zinc transporter), member 1/2/3
VHSLDVLKYTIAFIILISTFIASWIPLRRQLNNGPSREFPLLEALASGIFLGAGLIHMLADANNDFIKLNIHYPVAFLLAGLVFLLLLYLEHLGKEIHHHKKKEGTSWVVLLVIILSIHSLLAGTALGLSLSTSTTIMVTIAIIAHKWAASFALAVEINKSSMSLRNGIKLFILFALMTPLGIFFGNYLNFMHPDANLWQAIFMALASGTFLYIGTLHGLTRAVMINRCCNAKEFSLVILGFVIMAVVALIA